MFRESGGAPTARPREIGDLLVPGIEAIGLHADGDVEIEADLHAQRFRAIPASPQLTVGGPLHEFDEFDFDPVGPVTQARAAGLIGLPPLLGPFPPWRAECVPQYLETGEPRQERRALGAEFCEIPLAAARRLRPEILEGCSQRAPFQFGDRDIVDDVALSQPGEGVAIAVKIAGLEFRQSFDVDVERIQKQPAVRRIGAAIGRPVIEQSMQRIEADAIGSQSGGEFD